ncbi:uncharacterized protein LOC114956756 isoform X1 [Acropora millepora]|uniref:uncharacterized protein LOC114956756 isoform X1 n=1 Tax=Acropora millepora TaxID=45264 RepID=UPI001CF3514B|nr:uncharacterized protein LOC114956756 isoform X1 [Acropora millepora]
MPSISDIKQVIKIVFRIKDFTISLGSFKFVKQIKQIIIMTKGTTVSKFCKALYSNPIQQILVRKRQESTSYSAVYHRFLAFQSRLHDFAFGLKQKNVASMVWWRYHGWGSNTAKITVHERRSKIE